MRVATFNVLSGRSPGEGKADLERFRAAVQELDADLLGLQEVDRNQPRSRHADLTAVAGEAMGASYQRFAASLVGTPGVGWAVATGDESAESTAYGIAFLSRYDVLGARVVRLPGAPVPVPHRPDGRLLPRLVRDEPRVAIVADVETPLGRIDVVTTHLSFLSPWNRVQLRRLVPDLGSGPRPVVLMGDLNLGPGAARRWTGMAPLATGLTFPADAPTRQIDHILATQGLTARHGAARELPMSDHRALVADL
jgi:endonuclease/exonuclease/phosphatase family metal-dependent hydrolase